VVEHRMDVSGRVRKQLEEASPDLLRAMVQDFAEALMGAEVEALCGAGYGERTPERVNRRNGYRERDWDTRVGSIELAVPKLRTGSYFPDWLLQPRRRAEQAFVAVIAGLSRRRLHPSGAEAGAAARRRADVAQPGLPTGEEPRPDRRGLPHPPARPRPVRVRDAGVVRRGRRRPGRRRRRGRGKVGRGLVQECCGFGEAPLELVDDPASRMRIRTPVRAPGLIRLIAAEAFRAKLCFGDAGGPQCPDDTLDHGGRSRDQVGERAQLATKVVMEKLSLDAS
jgi:Transposase, Mutator family